MTSQNDHNSVSQILQLFKYLKSTSSDLKQKDLSTLSFSSKNYQSVSAARNPLDSIYSQNLANMIGPHGYIGHSHTNRNAQSQFQEQNNYNSYKTSNISSIRNKQDHIDKDRDNISKRYNKKQPKKSDVFNKLYKQGKNSQIRKCLLQYQTRKSIQEKQRSQCTFSPNIRNRKRVQTQYNRCGSVQNNQSFYLKNIQWLQRKQEHIKKLQVQKNQQNANSFTFTPKINKNCGFRRNQGQNRENQEIVQRGSTQKIKRSKDVSVVNNKGVYNYLQRQQKAKKNQQYVKKKQKNPYSHVWNIKKGYFSYVK